MYFTEMSTLFTGLLVFVGMFGTFYYANANFKKLIALRVSTYVFALHLHIFLIRIKCMQIYCDIWG